MRRKNVLVINGIVIGNNRLTIDNFGYKMVTFIITMLPM
jgi:hypothetical protein